MVTQKQRANLKPFKPGESGNPGGFVKHGRIDKICREYLDAIDPNDPLKRQRKIALVAAVYAAAKGEIKETQVNMQAVAWLADRGWGKVPDKLDLDNKGMPLFELVHAIQQNRITNQLTRGSHQRVAD